MYLDLKGRGESGGKEEKRDPCFGEDGDDIPGFGAEGIGGEEKMNFIHHNLPDKAEGKGGGEKGSELVGVDLLYRDKEEPIEGRSAGRGTPKVSLKPFREVQLQSDQWDNDDGGAGVGKESRDFKDDSFPGAGSTDENEILTPALFDGLELPLAKVRIGDPFLKL